MKHLGLLFGQVALALAQFGCTRDSGVDTISGLECCQTVTSYYWNLKCACSEEPEQYCVDSEDPEDWREAVKPFCEEHVIASSSPQEDCESCREKVATWSCGDADIIEFTEPECSFLLE